MTTAFATAAVLQRYGERLQNVEYQVPTAEPGALVVAMEVATVCASDVHAWNGAYEGILPSSLPSILGHEGVGRIVEIGRGADRDSMGTSLSVGDRVVWTPEPCMHCWVCTIDKDPASCPSKSIGMFTCSDAAPHFHGTFAEYSYVRPRAGRIRVPDEVASTWASAASCAMRTVVKAIEKIGRIDHTDSVVIQGAGALGLFATAILATRGPAQLVVVGAPDARLEVAREWGATHTCSIDDHPTPEARIAAVRALTHGRGASIVIEVAGVPGAVAEGVEMVARKGRYVLVGTAAGPLQPIAVHRIVTQDLTLMGSFSGDTDAYYKALEFMRSQRERFDWNRVLGERYPLDHVTDALRALSAHQGLKPVIIINQMPQEN